MIDVLINSLVPIFAVMGIGYFAGWIRDVDNRHVAESGFFSVLFGLRYGIESHEAGSTLMLSSLVSIVTLAIVLVLTTGW